MRARAGTAWGLAALLAACSSPGLPPVPRQAPVTPFPSSSATAPPLAGGAHHPQALDGAAALEEQLFDAVNQWRAVEGLGALGWSPAVASLARVHSEAMASGAVAFGHEGMQARFASAGVLLPVARAAENVSLHRKTPDRVAGDAMELWIEGPDHRANLGGAYDVTGIGAARAPDGTTYLTQIFIARH